MAENELNTLEDVTGEVPPIIATEPPPEPVDGAPPAEIDTTPDPAKLEADIAALQARKEKAAKEAGYWQRKELESRRAAMQPTTPPAKTETPAPATVAEPNQDDFADYNDYVAAVADQRVKVARTEWEREAADKNANENNAKRQADLQTKLETGYEKYPDFADVAFDHTAIHITPMIVDILADCENPADVAYHLAKDRIDGVRISRMTPTQAAREIAKIDLSYGGGGKAPSPKKTTNAPPPIKPVGASNTAGDKDPDKMTQAEYNVWREKQGAKRF